MIDTLGWSCSQRPASQRSSHWRRAAGIKSHLNRLSNATALAPHWTGLLPPFETRRRCGKSDSFRSFRDKRRKQLFAPGLSPPEWVFPLYRRSRPAGPVTHCELRSPCGCRREPRQAGAGASGTRRHFQGSPSYPFTALRNDEKSKRASRVPDVAPASRRYHTATAGH
jgi:hypothetical protein